MTLEEAIHHARMTAETREDLCEECRKEHLQLADWLQELQESRELINRQKAEIERLTIDKCKLLHERSSNFVDDIKSEAIKEFVERLKKIMITNSKTEDGYCEYETEDYYIDNLVKEMTEENNG